MNFKIEHIAFEQMPPSRLSDYIVGKFTQLPSRKACKKAIKRRQVFLNGKTGKSGDYIHGGEHIEINIDDVGQKRPEICVEYPVFYEDDYLAVIYKPGGIAVSGNQKRTIQNSLSKALTKSESDDALFYPEPVHRLDYPTSGALIIAKTRTALVRLNSMFEEGKIQKSYLAVTIGVQRASGRIDGDVDGKISHTEYSILAFLDSEKYGRLNLLELLPKTGRKHQLRIHLSSIGHPVLGDKQYGKEGLISHGNGLYLHAYALQFTHPISKADTIVIAPVPKKIKRLFPESFDDQRRLV